MNHKISQIKGLHRTKLDESGEQTSKSCTRTLCLPPTTFLFLWLQNEIHFAVVEGTKITRFLIRNEHEISHLKGLQSTTPDGLGVLASKRSSRTLCLPPTTLLFMWFQNEIHFNVVEGTKITSFLIRNEQKISHLKGLQSTTPDESGVLAST